LGAAGDAPVIDVERVDFLTLATRDLPQARNFYVETLGLPESKGDEHRFAEFETANATIALFNPELLGREFKPNPNPVALRVPDVAAARAKLEAAGVEFEGEIIDSGVCHMAFFKDPDGNSLMLHRRYAPEN
jgi:catechol 2,3-dioxygenase-like lactoylglutathione lyase family enzyme